MQNWNKIHNVYTSHCETNEDKLCIWHMHISLTSLDSVFERDDMEIIIGGRDTIDFE